MTDKEFNRTKKRIQKSLDLWIPIMGLKWQRKIDIQYKDEADGVEDNVVARTTAEWEYQHAVIVFYVSRLHGLKDDEIDYFVRHELCHILVNPMVPEKRTAAATKCEELTVTKLAQAFDFVRQMSRGKK